MIRQFDKKKFFLSFIIYLLLSSLSFMVFRQFENIKVSDILVSFIVTFPLNKLDAQTIMFVILWIAPQIYLLTYGFNGFYHYFRNNIIYFVIRGEKISKSYWMIFKTVFIEMTLMIMLRMMLILALSGQLKLLFDLKIIIQIILFTLITNLLVFVCINLFIIFQSDVLFPILVLFYLFLVFLFIYLKLPLIEVLFIRGSLKTLCYSIVVIGLLQGIQLYFMHQCIKQVEYK